MKRRVWEEVAGSLGLELTASQFDQLSRFEDWLVHEAIPAGGIGRSERNRVDPRHVADSLLFTAGFERMPDLVRDLGSGVGLPGIPLAIVHPETRFQLVDRSGKRVDLIKRASRILDLSNVSTVTGDLARVEGQVPGIVSRASLPPDRMIEVARRQLLPGGTVVLGGSWRREPDQEGWETRAITLPVLDHVVWLLIIRRQ